MRRIQHKLHEIIFEADTPAGKAFDVGLLIAIILSVLVVMLESVSEIRIQYAYALSVIEWIFTILFSIEYILRMVALKRPLKYVFSFFGIIDLLSILPTYVGLLLPQQINSFIIIRTIRLLRVFRIFKLARFLSEAEYLGEALKASRARITVFLGVVVSLCVVLGTVMYIIEGSVNSSQFSSIPRSIYWAIVTMTTVGYGDIAPITILGQTLAAFIMILGYGIIAVPTGIVTVEFNKAIKKHENQGTQACPSCATEGHYKDANYCWKCGHKLHLDIKKGH